MTTPRQAGRYGLIPGSIVNAPYAHNFMSVKYNPTYPVDASHGIVDWGMLGNDQYGDCTFAGREHYKMAKAAAAQLTEQWETTSELINEYLTYTNGQDTGANISQLLLSWYNDGKILAFAKIDHTDPACVDWFMQNFNGVYFGVALTDDADELFSAHQPWTTDQGQTPNPYKGHCIVKVTATTDRDGWVTWGGIQLSTKNWTEACSEGAYVIITGEDVKNHNIQIDQLTAALDHQVEVHNLKVVPPAPAPVPPAPKPVPPVPAPVPAPPASLCKRIRKWIKG